MKRNFKLIFMMLMLFATTFIHASEKRLDVESTVANSDADSQITQGYLENDISVIATQEAIRVMKNSYISPYNYSQNPIALNMGYDTRSSESTGTFSGGISIVGSANYFNNGNYTEFNTDVAQLWGQTGRWNGFALGAGGTAVFNGMQINSNNAFATRGILAPTQAYVDYQFSNIVDVTVGNILISTPWVTSFGSNPGLTYGMGNNSYQGVLVNVQPLKSLLFTAYTAWGYLQYPNNWYSPQNFYNYNGGVLYNRQPTYGTTGIGVNWNPVDSYSARLWLYNFENYANLAYVDNSYHLNLPSIVSMDFGLQGFMEQGSGITTQTVLPGMQNTAGSVSSNGLGAKISLNIGDNTTSISFNNIFGPNGSYLNGGMVTPYTYGMEVDPLYTTPALTSLAEQGSGYAYTLRNSTWFMDKNLKFNLSASQFFVNQVYSGQPNQINEYDGSLMYSIPHTHMNIWTRLVYLEQPDYYGGNMWQPRIIYNWTF